MLDLMNLFWGFSHIFVASSGEFISEVPYIKEVMNELEADVYLAHVRLPYLYISTRSLNEIYIYGSMVIV